jgi:signal transduction histidine kinase
MRVILLILFASFWTGAAPGQSAAARPSDGLLLATNGENVQVIAGTLTLVDSNRNLIVIQERGRAKALKLDTLPAALRVGARVAIEGQPEIYFDAFPDYPNRPSSRDVLGEFESPPDQGDHTLTRLRGFLHPPADGDYIFWIAADDEGELWLSPNSEPALAQKIATVAAAVGDREWNRDAGQKSAAIFLKAGETYYIEALQREWRGRDHLAVAWQGPGLARRVIGGENLSPWLALGGITNGILREYWTNCFLTRLSALAPKPAGAAITKINAPRVRLLGGGELPEARRIRVDRSWTDERNYLWVEVDGTANFVSTDQGQLTLELADRDERMTVRIFGWGDRPTAPWLQRRVRVQGVCEVVLTSDGEPTAGRLWVPDPRHLTPLDQTLDSRDLEMVSMFDLTPDNLNLAWGRKVLVRGTATERDADSNVYRVRGDDSFYGFVSNDGTNWQSVGTPVPVLMGDVVLVGLAVSSLPDPAAVATFDHLSLAPEASLSVGLGNNQAKGSAIISNGVVTITAGDGNNWLAADTAHFWYQPLQGEGEIVARLTAFQTSRASDKAGLMIRESLRANAPSVALIMAHGRRVDLQYRPTRGAGSKQVDRLNRTPPQWLKLVRRQHTLTAHVLEGETLPLRKPIELVGTLGWQNGVPILLDAYERRGRRRTDPEIAPVMPAPGVQQILIADLPADPEQSQQIVGEKFRIRGVVTFMDQVFNRNLLFVQDESGGAGLRVLRSFFESHRIEPGEWLEAEGQVRFAAGDPLFGLTSGTILGWGQMPKPLPFPDRTAVLKADGQWVEASGVVRAIKDDTFYVMEKEGLLRVWVGHRAASHPLDSYVDSLVTLRGVFTMQFSAGPILLVPSPQFIQVREAAPPDPFVIPPHPIAKVRARQASPQSLHRTKLTGVVTYRDARVLCLQDPTGGARILAAVPGNIAVGDRVEAVGFPERGGGSLTLVETLLRRIGRDHPPEPAVLSLDDLLAGRRDSTLVRLEGVVLDQKLRDGYLLLELQSGQRAFEAILPPGVGKLPPLPAGSRVQITGVNQLQFASHQYPDASQAFQPVPASLGVLLRSPADVVLLQRPPWWNWRHSVGVIAVFALVLVASLVWIRTLRLRVEERTRELKKTMGRLQKETEVSATLAERDRLAAEIHDTFEQGLSGIMMQLDGVDSRLNADPEGARKFLEMARRMVRFNRSEVRSSLWNLESALLENGDLGAALKEIARQMSVGNSGQVKVEFSGVPHPLPPTVEHHLLRCTQEALNNALKHAGATVIQIKLSYLENSVQLAVTDDGCGFEPETVLTEVGKHLGLRNLRSRSRKIKAQLAITSHPGQGTTIQLTVPQRTSTEKPAPPSE